MIVKALNDLMHALKVRRNKKGPIMPIKFIFLRSQIAPSEEDTPCPNGMHSPSAHEQREERDMDRKCNGWVVLLHITRTISLPYHLCKKHKEHMSIRHSKIQA